MVNVIKTTEMESNLMPKLPEFQLKMIMNLKMMKKVQRLQRYLKVIDAVKNLEFVRRDIVVVSTDGVERAKSTVM